MGIFRKSKPAITSAHTPVITGDEATDKDILTTRSKDWQDKTLLYADTIPEVAAAGSFIYNTLNNIKYQISIPDSEESPGLEKIQDTINEWLEAYRAGRNAEHIFYIGETIIGYEQDGADIHWRNYAISELKYDKTNKTYKLTDDQGKHQPIPDTLKLFKVYKPSRTNRYEATSNHKAIVDLLEAFFLHQLVDIAISQSRLAGAGIFLIPDDDFDNAKVDENGQYPDGSLGDIINKIAGSMTQSIRNRRSNEAFIPFMLASSRESIDKFKHLMLERNDDASAFETRINTYRKRYAAGIDLPQEIILGIGDSNHWTSWKIDDNTYQYHLHPLAQLIGDALLNNFIEPVAEALGYSGVIELIIDGSDVISKPDKTEVYTKLAAMDRLTNEGISELFDIPIELIKTPEIKTADTSTGQSLIDQLSVGLTTKPPGLQSDIQPKPPGLQAALKKKISSIPDKFKALDSKVSGALERILKDRIPNIVKARLATINAANYDEEVAVLLADVRRLSNENLRQRLKIIEAAVDAPTGSLFERFNAELTARGDRLASVIAAYAGFVSDQEKLLKQSAGDKTPTSSIKSRYAPHPGVLRSAIDIQNGGTGITTPDYMTMIVRPADVNTDPIVSSPLAEAGVEKTALYVWVYGDEETRRMPFEEHVELDGETWRAAQESDALDNDGSTAAGVWFPGDHAGCQCEYDIIWE